MAIVKIAPKAADAAPVDLLEVLSNIPVSTNDNTPSKELTCVDSFLSSFNQLQLVMQNAAGKKGVMPASYINKLIIEGVITVNGPSMTHDLGFCLDKKTKSMWWPARPQETYEFE